jgi:predicted MFS family arabinose efflux permease
MIVGVSAIAGIAIVVWLQPVTAHLSASSAKQNPIEHLVRTATRPRYLVGFSATIFLAVGGFMLMPFGSTFLVQNLGIPMPKLPMVYMVTGVAAMISGPVLGRVSDAFGKYRTFLAGTIVSSVMVLWYTGLTSASLGFIIALNVVLFIGISARMVSSFALTSALPELSDRGAYMSISSSLQQLAGGIASWSAGLIVHQATPTSPLDGYPRLGWIVVGAMVLTVGLMFNVHRRVSRSAA